MISLKMGFIESHNLVRQTGSERRMTLRLKCHLITWAYLTYPNLS
jgi:hypothetical protein